MKITLVELVVIFGIICCGCATRTVEISSDRWVVSLHKGDAFIVPSEGKFVPSARFKEMLDVYIRAGNK